MGYGALEPFKNFFSELWFIVDARSAKWSDSPVPFPVYMKIGIRFLVVALALAAAFSSASATDRFWSGDGGSDNINDSGNWFNGTPATSDNLYFNNTGGTGANRHFTYFNYGDYFTFGKIIYYTGSGGFTNQLYGDALKFTSVIENNVSDQLQVYNKNVSVANDGSGLFYINAFGGNIYFKQDGAGGTGASSAGSFFLAGQTMTLQGSKNITFESIIADGVEGTGNITSSSTGTVTFSGTAANTYTGTTTVNSGTLSLSKATDAVTAVSGNLTIAGGTVSYGTARDEQIADSAKVTLSSGTYAMGARVETIGQTATAASGFSMTGGSVTISSGTLTLANSAAISGGAVTITAGGTINANTELNFSGGTIDFSATSGTPVLNLRGGTGTGITYSSSGVTTAQITNSGGLGTVSLNQAGSGPTTVFNIADSPSVATEMIIAAPITGAGKNLQKIGTGVLQLAGASTYTGTTTITAGTLRVDNNNTTTARLAGTAGISVNSGATLLLSQTGVLSSDRINNSAGVTIVGGGNLSTGGLSEGTRPSGPSLGSGGAAGMGALTLQSTSSSSRAVIDFASGANGSSLVFSNLASTGSPFVDILNWTGSNRTDNGATSNDRLLFAASTNLTDANLANFRWYADGTGTPFMTGATMISYGDIFEVVPIPEPSTWCASALALAVIGYSFSANRRKRALRAS